MPNRANYTLTPSQREHLVLLERGGAHSRDSAKHIFDPGMRKLNPGVIGILIDKGFADNRRVKPSGGSQRTLYWLTEAGRAQARALEAAST